MLGFLLALVVGEPLRAHDCAMHLGAVRSASVTGGQHVSGGHEHHAGAGLTQASAADIGAEASGFAATAADESHPDNHADSQEQHNCDCLGTCCTVAAVRLASLPDAPVAVAALAEPELPAILGVAPAPRTDRLLPFPNGPPTPAA